MPGYRLVGDYADSKQEEGDKEVDADSKQEQGNKEVDIVIKETDVEFDSPTSESQLFSIPFDILKIIMENCVGVEYLKFRATCKYCESAAPIIQRSNEDASKRFHGNSFVSPWLMVFDQHQGIITFTDPLFGDKYFIKTPRELVCDLQIFCSKYGWLLMYKGPGPMVFFNPFTSDIIELPTVPYLDSFCFSAPPTSTDCMVVGFSSSNCIRWNVFIQFVAREPSWRTLRLNFNGDDPYSFRFPTFYGRDLYVLGNDKTLDVFRDIGKEDYSWDEVIDEVPMACCKSSEQYFLAKCEHNLLLIVMGKYGESIEVYRSDDDEENWEKIECLGRHMIYICDKTCLCVEAKIPEMENKIYFPQFHPNNEKIVFYSLETRRYHTFNEKNIQEDVGDLSGMKYHLSPHVWIEPSW